MSTPNYLSIRPPVSCPPDDFSSSFPKTMNPTTIGRGADTERLSSSPRPPTTMFRNNNNNYFTQLISDTVTSLPSVAGPVSMKPAVTAESALKSLLNLTPELVEKFKAEVMQLQEEAGAVRDTEMFEQLKLIKQMVCALPTSKDQKKEHKGKVKTILPCFNLICTGTCAYGPKCTFLHDPRAQLPKSVRRQAEFLLQSHLHTYRPNNNTKKLPVCPNNSFSHSGDLDDDNRSVHSADSTHSGSTATSNITAHKPINTAHNKAAYRKDDIFDFPAFEVPLNDINAKCYDPNEEERAKHSREISMWYHLLAVINDNTADTYLAKAPFCKPRLPVFQELHNGREVKAAPIAPTSKALNKNATPFTLPVTNPPSFLSNNYPSFIK